MYSVNIWLNKNQSSIIHALILILLLLHIRQCILTNPNYYVNNSLSKLLWPVPALKILNLPSFCPKIANKGCSHIAPTIWNRIPFNFQSALTVTSFCKLLETSYFDHPPVHPKKTKIVQGPPSARYNFGQSNNNPLIFDYDWFGAFEPVLQSKSAFKISHIHSFSYSFIY